MVTLKIYNLGLDRLDATQLLTLRDPCSIRDPYVGKHWYVPCLSRQYCKFLDPDATPFRALSRCI